jgi:hypothetical protein
MNSKLSLMPSMNSFDHHSQVEASSGNSFLEDVRGLITTSKNLSNHNFLELLGLIDNKKRVVRLIVTDTSYRIVREFCRKHGLLEKHSFKKQAPKIEDITGDTFTVSVDWDDPRGEFFAVIVGRRADDLEQALALEDNDASFRAFGEMYEYPPCCVEAYEDLERGGNWISTYLSRSAPAAEGSIYTNRLGVLFDGHTLLPDFFPCKLNCPLTEDLGRRYESLLQQASAHVYVNQARRSLSAPIVVRCGFLIQLYECRRSADGWEFDSDQVRVICWDSSVPPDNSFREADTVQVSEGRFRLLCGSRILIDQPVELLNNRLLTFREN